MHILGILFALGAGLFFGIVGPVTKTAYNLGTSVDLTIFLRYLVTTTLIMHFIPFQKNLITVYIDNLHYFLLITLGSIFLTIGQSNTAFFLYSEPVATIIGDVLLLGETLEIYQILGAFIVLLSLALATYLTSKPKNVFA